MSDVSISTDQPLAGLLVADFSRIMAGPSRPRFGFGSKAALINIDLQKAYTCVGEYPTA